ncbi:hypothetical protein Angca_004548 [Angiostrongylus cantonensis]|nr:hypothetical protein Angca_004548 [Angiostrongylus cantonensis]
MTRIDERAGDNTAMDAVVAKKGNDRVTLKELNCLISEVQEYPLKLDSNWLVVPRFLSFLYVVSNIWWSKVLEASRQGYVEDIPPIDNSSISYKSGDSYFLRPNLAESIDFHLLPEPVFNRLREVYGLELTSRDYIYRKVVSKNGKPVVEVYPRIVMVYLAKDPSRYCELRLTDDDTLMDLRDRALESLGLSEVPPERLRFYIAHGDNYELIHITLQNVDSYFDTAQKVMMFITCFPDAVWVFYFSFGFFQVYIDVCDLDNTWSINHERHRNSKIDFASNSLSSYSFYEGSREKQGVYVKGACGLQNLGNTCFMASALQCLSNVPELTEYFLSNKYVADVNKKNPLGTHGELARAYGDLLQSMWSGENCSVVPRRVKMTIGQFAPRFSGYAQQDSQELLAYVLDGLHEDLNRIKVKPYVPDDETLERLEEHEQAERSWQAYKARNDSIIVDLVHGQLKSTLVCPVCAKVSIKFDPFCFLSVPLPPKEKVRQVVTLIFNSKRRWAKFTITMANSTTVQDAINTMKNSLQNVGNDFTGEIIVYSIGFGELSDEVRLLDPAEPIYIEDKNQSLYACQVDHNPNTHKVVVIKNQTQTGRTLSLPMVFTLPSPDSLTRSFLANRVLPFISDTFMKSSLEMCLNDYNLKIGEEREQYKLFVIHGCNAVPFPIGDEPVPFTGGIQMHTVVFQWKASQIFNQYKGADLIDREVSVSSRKDMHLMECIDLFTKQEQLGEEDSWYCPKCKKHERATKKLDLWNLPQILIIHLKRFQYSKWHRDKIDIPVVIPIKGFELNSKLANERHEHVKYDLIAVSHHVGGLGGGHYTATALNKTTGKWYEFNDSCVSEVAAPTDPMVGRTPYMLFYRRQQVMYDNASPDANVEEEMEE